MARLRQSESASRSSLYRDPSTPPYRAQNQNPQSSASPTPSKSSDKENPPDTRQRSKSTNTTLETSDRASSINTNSNKRRRLGERPDLASPALQSRPSYLATEISASNQDEEENIYDPHQPMEDRRKLRKGMRDLSKDVVDNRAEWMQSDSRGLQDALVKGDEIYRNVKQTTDATIDSGFLVSAGDIAYKRSKQANIGQAAQGIDVDDFVGKCITFMRVGDDDHYYGHASTQRRRIQTSSDRANVAEDDDEDHGDDGDALNWERLGTVACLPINMRPSTMSFLLGPLSLVKRPRNARSKLQRRGPNPTNTTQPVEITPQDATNAQNESAGLRASCERLYKLFKQELDERMAKASEDFENYEEQNGGIEVPDKERELLLEKYHLADDGGMAFFPLVINPNSFGQTIENLFHISFLVKDNYIGLEMDPNGMPSLHDVKSASEEEQARRTRKGRQQHVFSMDFETWEELVEGFGLKGKESIIPDRSEKEKQRNRVTANGWYT